MVRLKRVLKGIFPALFIVIALVTLVTVVILAFPLLDSSVERDSPSDRILPRDVIVEKDRIIIRIPNAQLVGYENTNSMDPLLDSEANGIEIQPESEEDIFVGDIVTFRYGRDFIVHRVVEIGEDEDGKYFVTKGDNNNMTDGRIRFDDVEYLTVGVLW